MLLKYLNGSIFEIGVGMAVADLAAILLASLVSTKTSLVVGYITTFMGGVTLLHRCLHVKYDIDGFFTDSPAPSDTELPEYRKMRILGPVTRFGISLSGVALFIVLYDSRIYPWDRDHSFVWTFSLLFASTSFLIAEASPPFVPYIFLLVASFFGLIHTLCVSLPPPAPFKTIGYTKKARTGRARNLSTSQDKLNSKTGSAATKRNAKKKAGSRK